MQPYQAATEEVRKQSQKPTQLLNAAGAIAGSAIGGSALASRILPLINKFVPGEIMRKGLSKVSPRMGKFVDSALNNGYNLDDIRSYIQDKFSPEEEEKPPETQENTQNQPNMESAEDFESNYPMLAKALMETIQQGKNPQEAAAILKKSTALGSQVRDLEKQKGKKFEDYIIEMLGNAQKGMSQQPQQAQPQPEQMQQPQQPQQPQQGQPGGVDPQLLQLVQGLRNSIKGMRGG